MAGPLSLSRARENLLAHLRAHPFILCGRIFGIPHLSPAWSFVKITYLGLSVAKWNTANIPAGAARETTAPRGLTSQ